VTALVLAHVNEAAGLGKPPPSPDRTQPTRRVIFESPPLTSPGAPVGMISGLAVEPMVTAIRRDAGVQADRSVFFTRDRVSERPPAGSASTSRRTPHWSASGWPRADSTS